MLKRILVATSILFGLICNMGAHDALDEVNETRAKKGLPAFVLDEGLMEGARKCADYRAARLMEGHTSNDFAFLPEGSWADAGGCAAWPADMGWGACCTYENWKYAGAAYTVGRDGQRYMYLFVRGNNGGQNSSPSYPSYNRNRWRRR